MPTQVATVWVWGCSLQGSWCHIFTVSNLKTGSVTLIAVDLVAVRGAVQTDILAEIRRVLERCIHVGQDLLLPLVSNAGSVETCFIVACTDASGFAIIAGRIGRELQNFDNISRLKPVISSTTLLLAPGESREEQIHELTARIEQLIQAHILGEEKLK